MRTLSPMAALSALPPMAAPDDRGGATTTDPAADTDVAEVAEGAAAPTAEVETAAEAPAEETEEAAPKKGKANPAAPAKSVLMIWAQPGHERYFIGQPVEFPAADAEFLRAAGRAREATKDEVKAWKVARKAPE